MGSVEYRAGDAGNYEWAFPAITKYSNIKLTRAACEDTTKVKKWLSDTSFKHKPDILTIQLFDGAEGRGRMDGGRRLAGQMVRQRVRGQR